MFAGTALCIAVMMTSAFGPNRPEMPGLSELLQVTVEPHVVNITKDKNNLLQNRLTLRIQNIGDSPLYHGKTLWTTNAAKATVSFDFCHNSSCLTCDDRECLMAANGWNIKYQIHVPMYTPWYISDAGVGYQHPQWTVSPSKTNIDILGPQGAKESSVAFDFFNIITLLPPGETNMYVRFHGFPYDETRTYEDANFKIPFVKK
eukprot:m.118109 g.118109  ORF g.118109 m.118109 type:complete len:203 (-) comp14272_c0_seq4:153-761(-)